MQTGAHGWDDNTKVGAFSLDLAHRLALLVAADSKTKPWKLSILTDFECSIALTRKTGGVLKPYSANRVGEIEKLSNRI